jgi:thiol:disulfide interchange protein
MTDLRSALSTMWLAACWTAEPRPAQPPQPTAVEPSPQPAVATPFAWAPDEATAFRRAKLEHKAVLIDFYAGWSLPSVELEAQLRGARVIAAIAPHFVPVKIDITDAGSDAVEEIQVRYQVTTSPTLILIDVDGRELGRIVSLPTDDELVAALGDAWRRR